MTILSPFKSLNKSYRRLQIDNISYNKFLDALNLFINNIHDNQNEEQQKDILTCFLRDAFYSSYCISAVDNIDLAIRINASSSSNVGVMFEIKGLGRPDMPNLEDLNTKAFQELLLYYFRQRKNGNIDIRNLIITNTHEFYIFDAQEFERLFYNDRELRRKFDDFERGTLSSNKTEYFYSNIASPAIADVIDSIKFTYFDLNNYQTEIRNRVNSGKLTDLYRLLSPVHLLKLPFQNDSNTLNEQFYKELLHLIGLEEYRDGNKSLIRRKEKNNRENASLLENAITIMEAEAPRLNSDFGETLDDRYYTAAMELCIVWINRILFLKLLEAQLLNYHDGSSDYRFLTYDKIPDFDGLNRLFFQVMAVENNRRRDVVKNLFPKVPYLNSSLFEPTELERQCLKISGLEQSEQISILRGSVLKNDVRYEGKTKLPFLEYLFSFLDAYNFSSEGTGEVADKPKTLINASVLGLIFEKINGYKDGAVFTPGYITQYMCKSAIRSAVLDKFNKHYNCTLKNFDDILNEDYDKHEINRLINTLTICDPAVGSGHFLVSALNEIILIKYELGCLFDSSGVRIRSSDYNFSIENDELIITDENGELWKYKPKIDESLRIQAALFNEKRNIIENCLFGVDINPNSVNICRLRLWIELLKNAYYTDKEYTHLETLPNIDINIKCGNSLLQKYNLSDSVLHKDIKEYKKAVCEYKRTKNKDDKTRLEVLIKKIKSQLSNDICEWMDVMKKYRKAERLLHSIEEKNLLENVMSAKEQRNYLKYVSKVTKEFEKRKKALDEAISDKIFRNGFEWRMEFPEILDDKGQFVGFDIIIGNPPYGVSVKDPLRTKIMYKHGRVPDYEIYYFFIELAHKLLKNEGTLCFIIPNTYLFNTFAYNYRRSLINNWIIIDLLDCTKIPIFKSAVVRNTINLWKKQTNTTALEGGLNRVAYRNTSESTSFESLISKPILTILCNDLMKLNQNWGLAFSLDSATIKIVNLINSHPNRVYPNFQVSQGYIPYRLSDLIKEYGETEGKHICNYRSWHSPSKIGEDYIQELNGRDISKYDFSVKGEFVKYGKHLACYVDLRFFNNDRIVVREITNPHIIACRIDKDVTCVHDPQLISIIENTNNYKLNLLWAILNSKLATFYHFNHSPKATKGAFPKILVQDIKDFPIPEISENIRVYLEKTVKIIISGKRANPNFDTSILENEIDVIMYKLYGLTYDEVRIVDPATPISREQYESFNIDGLS